MPASYSVSLKDGTIAAHFDLPTNDVATVTLGEPGDGRTARRSAAIREVEIVAHSSTAPIYYTTDGTTPTVRGGNCFAVPTGPAGDKRIPATYGPTVIKLLTAGTADLSVWANR